MDKTEAIKFAEGMLEKIIAGQPQLFGPQYGDGAQGGAAIAAFCAKFTEDYAAYILTQSKQED